VTAFEQTPADPPLVDAGDAVVMPGLVDTHVHINEPGRTEWEGFETATRAAAAGGVTTLVDMPLNSIPAATAVAGLRAKLEAAAEQCWVDVGFWGGMVPGNRTELGPLLAAGARGFKCFLVPSGVEEFPHVSEHDLREALPELAARGAVLLAHAELPGPLEAASATLSADPRSYAAYLRSRPPQAEVEAIRLLIRLCREVGARIHIVHLAAAEALPLLREARAEGLPITAESCPHYLHFAAEEIPDGATQLKCAPPIRERANRERLWEALGDGTIGMVGTDHSPCPPAMKALDSGDFGRAWGGISSLQLGLSVMWRGARERGYPLDRLAEWMSAAPARLAGLGHRKGAIAVGYDADLVVWSPETEFVVDPAGLHHRHKLTPYAGARLPGVVEMTFLRGEKIYDRGEFRTGPSGRILGPESP
ncbi:MAG TPA: allantoinase AllB, partial [Longimicrobiaceae bacterium]|nr:allantoinase AllB [Longimicrobiaceae bacterium]